MLHLSLEACEVGGTIFSGGKCVVDPLLCVYRGMAKMLNKYSPRANEISCVKKIALLSQKMMMILEKSFLISTNSKTFF